MFVVRVRECVEKSKVMIYEAPVTNDPHALVFSTYQPAIHDNALAYLKKPSVSIQLRAFNVVHYIVFITRAERDFNFYRCDFDCGTLLPDLVRRRLSCLYYFVTFIIYHPVERG